MERATSIIYNETSACEGCLKTFGGGKNILLVRNTDTLLSSSTSLLSLSQSPYIESHCFYLFLFVLHIHEIYIADSIHRRCFVPILVTLYHRPRKLRMPDLQSFDIVFVVLNLLHDVHHLFIQVHRNAIRSLGILSERLQYCRIRCANSVHIGTFIPPWKIQQWSGIRETASIR